MTRDEFKRLRDLPGKVIRGDITFTAPKDTKPNLVFDQVQVENDLKLDVVLNGTYKKGIPSCTFNFVLRGTGPICRYELNSARHGNAGRTHKHDMKNEEEPRLNLPSCSPRKDLEQLGVRELWETVCREANIAHEGQILVPEGEEP